MKNLVSPRIGQIQFSFQKTLWLYLMLFSSSFIDVSAISISDLILNIILLFTTVGIGHSVGLHRGIIHKSFKSNATFRKLSLYCFVLTGLGSPLNWLKQHYFRDYWQNRTDCPPYFQYKHSLIKDYYWNLHLSFVPNKIDRYHIPENDLKDPVIQKLHKFWYLHYLLFMFLIYVTLGFNSMLFLACFRTVLITLGHWYIGYASHKYGYARYSIQNADESGYNDLLLGLISFGEGFHNNHHSYPTSAKFTMRWYEIDLGWMLIWCLSKLRIITQVNTLKNTLKSTAVSNKSTIWKLPKF